MNFRPRLLLNLLTTKNMDITQRHKNIFNPENQMKITIIGAGSIGSNLTLLLARLGLTDICVYDDDIVEDHNLGHQAFRVDDIFTLKTEALRDIVKAATGTEIEIVSNQTDGKEIVTDILILAVDSMAARKTIFENAKYSFCVDGRMGGETFNIYAFSGADTEAYEKTLYSDAEASDLPCGGKSIGYVSYMISALMEVMVKKIINEEEYPFEQNFCAKNLIYQTSWE